MKAPVRVVCSECLESLEFSSDEGSTQGVSCHFCGATIDLARAASDAPTGDGLDGSPEVFSSSEPTPRDGPRVDSTPPKIGRFIVREQLGEGGYGQVFRAYDPHLDRDVALKVLKANRLGEKSLERFLREARAAARLDHPNIVGLHDAGRDEGRCWIAYQLVAGRTLSLIRDVDRPSVDDSVRIIRELAIALDHAHGRGVFHRDLKPANVLIDASGRPRLTDFGLARRENVDSDLTREGTVLGTPHYMSPEAAAGRAHAADARSDVYSLGVILYELICGRRPADMPSGAPLWQSTRLVNPPTPRSVDRAIPAALDRICMKALAFDPADRHPDARSLADALTRYLRERPEPKPMKPARARPAADREKAPRGGMMLWTTVAATTFCLVFGVGFMVTSLHPVAPIPGVLQAGPIVGPTPTLSPISSSPTNPNPISVSHVPATASSAGNRHPAPTKFVYSKTSSSHVYHRENCSFVRAINPENRSEFADAATAEATNFKPCRHCKPGGGDSGARLDPIDKSSPVPSS